MNIDIFTDGGCRGNGSEHNIGAYSYILTFGDKVKTFAKVIENTTNNQMELMSVIEALKALKPAAREHDVTVFSDSQYVVRGINEWYKAWEAKNFYKVKNPELWKELITIKKTFPSIKFVWVKGHCKVAGNLDADKLCNDAMDGKIIPEE